MERRQENGLAPRSLDGAPAYPPITPPMDRNPSYGSEHEVKNWLLYTLMVIATVAVVAVSLIGIATMTGIIPRSGTGAAKAQAVGIETWPRTGSDGSQNKSEQRMQAAKKTAARSAAECDNCGGVEP